MIILIILAAVALRLPGIDKSFQGDEFFSVMDARQFSAIPDALMSDTHPPLYFYALHLWMKAGQSEAFLRILSIIAGTGVCVLAYLIGSTSFGKTAGIVSALIVTVSPVMVWSSQYVRTYSMACFFTVMSVYMLVLFLKSGGRGRVKWVAFVISSAAAIYTFYFSALIIIAENIYIFIFMRRERYFIKNWIISQIAILALYVPWMPFFLYQMSSYVAHPQMVQEAGFYFGGMHVGAIIRSLSGIAGFDPRLLAKGVMSASSYLKIASSAVVAVAGAYGVYLATRYSKLPEFNSEEKRYMALFIILAAAPFTIALFLHQTARIILMSHYFIASFVFLAIVLTALTGRVWSRAGQAAFLSFVLILFAARLACLYQDKEMDLKGAHNYVKALAETGIPVVAPSFGGMFDYYFFDVPKRYTMDSAPAMTISSPEIIVVAYPEKLELTDLNKRFGSSLAKRNYILKDSKRFGDLVVERYSRS